MKNITLVLTLFLTLSIIFSCSNRENIEEKKDYTELISKIESFGKQHNDGLDIFLDYVKKNPQKIRNLINSNTSRTLDNPSLVINTLNDIEYEAFESMNTFSLLTDNQLQEILNYSNTELVNKLTQNGIVFTDGDFNSIYSNQDVQNLSPQVKNLLDILNNALNDDLLDYNETIQEFTSVENIVNNGNFSDEEIVIVLSAVNVGKNSLTYWNTNYSEWNSVFETIGNKNTNRAFPWKKVGKADVAGAVTGAIRAAVINVWPGAGQAAYGASIVGTALGGSAGMAVLHWLN